MILSQYIAIVIVVALSTLVILLAIENRKIKKDHKIHSFIVDITPEGWKNIVLTSDKEGVALFFDNQLIFTYAGEVNIELNTDNFEGVLSHIAIWKRSSKDIRGLLTPLKEYGDK